MRPQRQAIGDYVTLNTAATALNQSYWRLYRLVRTKRVPAIYVGNTTMVRLEDVEREISK
jgi:hypothetical protein